MKRVLSKIWSFLKRSFKKVKDAIVYCCKKVSEFWNNSPIFRNVVKGIGVVLAIVACVSLCIACPPAAPAIMAASSLIGLFTMFRGTGEYA